ncbi:MAG TPA: aminoacyl-tRNA hydrolase [Candidatus Hydrogenedentes bacterium]|nr:aminoacyl-tRNA hydrolase [Candidatus Hydrogenedentota bacterium]
MWKLVAGLGNPGARYDRTRHNMGFMAVDALASRLGVRLDREKNEGLYAETNIGELRIMLVKPLTYMNRSGGCVAACCRNRIVDYSNVLVIVDDVNLPLGRLRLRPGGSDGGHNGLKSVTERLGTSEYPRLRLGVGRQDADQDLADYVLSRFTPEEWPAAEALARTGSEAALCWLQDGIREAMNRYNGSKSGKASTDE